MEHHHDDHLTHFPCWHWLEDLIGTDKPELYQTLLAASAWFLWIDAFPNANHFREHTKGCSCGTSSREVPK